jgi:hypothetical protein
MKKQFVSYEIAAAMEELGFKDECLGYYDRQSGELFFNDLDRGVIVPPEILLPAPLWQQAEQWLREKHNLDISYKTGLRDRIKCYTYSFPFTDIPFNWNSYNTYEEARANAIPDAIKIVRPKLKSESTMAETRVRPPMTKNLNAAKCPACGAPEIDAMTPRTVYECGSSDYDQRPGTFAQSEQCMKKTGGEK